MCTRAVVQKLHCRRVSRRTPCRSRACGFHQVPLWRRSRCRPMRSPRRNAAADRGALRRATTSRRHRVWMARRAKYANTPAARWSHKARAPDAAVATYGIALVPFQESVPARSLSCRASLTRALLAQPPFTRDDLRRWTPIHGDGHSFAADPAAHRRLKAQPARLGALRSRGDFASSRDAEHVLRGQPQSVDASS